MLQVARAPLQILVLPFRRQNGKPEFAIFRRHDDGYWQGIAGGGDDRETPVEAARREAQEEAGIPISTPLYRLQATSTVPVVCIDENRRRHWPRDLFVLPNYAFAVDCSGIDLKLSAEHTDFEWVEYERAYDLLRWESNKVAIWELRERLSRGIMPKPE
jgi:dATP pyrophosphohydrolase